MTLEQVHPGGTPYSWFLTHACGSILLAPALARAGSIHMAPSFCSTRLTRTIASEALEQESYLKLKHTTDPCTGRISEPHSGAVRICLSSNIRDSTVQGEITDTDALHTLLRAVTPRYCRGELDLGVWWIHWQHDVDLY
jgi:hypothetical protein